MKIEFSRFDIIEMIATLNIWRDTFNDETVTPILKKFEDALECPFE